MKDIKDYLHLYLGCEVMVTPPEAASFPCKLTGYVTKTTIYQNSGRVQVFEADGEDGYEGFGIRWFDEDEVELILRPLSDMTMDECEEASIICGKRRVYMPIYWQGKGDARFMYMTPEQCFRLTKYFLSKGFDLFGLIEAGLAIDKTDRN